jgi:Kef-type K+ transport system membrane component KefB
MRCANRGEGPAVAKNEGLSIRTITILLLVLVLVIGWCFFAAEYAKDVEGWQAGGGSIVSGRVTFVIAMFYAMCSMGYNGLAQLPNLFSVISHSIFERTALAIVFVMLLSLIVAFGVGLKVVEYKMEGPKLARRKKRRHD